LGVLDTRRYEKTAMKHVGMREGGIKNQYYSVFLSIPIYTYPEIYSD